MIKYYETEGPFIRRAGRTTRLVDDLIQKLFNNPGEEIVVYDHFETRASHMNLLNMVKRRFQSEHANSGCELISSKSNYLKLIKYKN